jgi:hypothetical protein
MSRSACVAALVLALTLGTAPLARADIVYTTLGPSSAYDTSGGAVFGGPTSFEGFFVSGFMFSPSETVNLSRIDAPFGLITGANSFTLTLRAADGTSGGPGTVLESFPATGRLGPIGTNALLDFNSATHPLLTAGTTYWLVATTADSTVAEWNVNNQGIHGTYYSIQGGRELLIPNQVVGAFQVSGNPLPEPASLTLLGLGACGLLAYAWRRRTLTTT